MPSQTPWKGIFPLPAGCMRELRRRAIFECCKWDPQVEDVDTLAPLALVLKQSTWRELARIAEALARETSAMESALIQRPDLHRPLALPRRVRKALAGLENAGTRPEDVRVIRFDFHLAEEGWRISEANTDVPGGYNEASGWAALVAEHVSEGVPTGDPAGQLVQSICARAPALGTVALVHATAYTDDRQVMTFLARRCEQSGLKAVLAAPDHLRWEKGQASIRTGWFTGRADFVFRFFPAEWLVNLPRGSSWPYYFGGSTTPVCNPATALLTQSKRLPLVWRELGVEFPTWRQMLPETRGPRDTPWRSDAGWVLKPALGRVGEMVGLAGVTGEREWKLIRRGARWGARHWVAQRRFTPSPLRVNGQCWYPCLGVFTINGRAAGIYGRAAPQPLINHTARDLAVLVEPTEPRPDFPAHMRAYESVGAI